MSCNYRWYTLQQLVNIKYGKSQKKVQDNEKGTYPIYGTGGLMGYAKEFLYDKPSVLIGRKGSISKIKYVEHPFWTVDTLFYTEVNNELVMPKYLYYKMSLIDFNYYNEGTTIPSLRTDTLNKIELQIPTLDVQRAVVELLNSLDRKIELNNEMNKTLEEMAQALFKRWFVDFEFPNENGEPYKSSGGEMVESELGMIPKGWIVYSIDKICDINMTNYSKKDNWSYINYLDTANITNNKIENIQKIDCLTDKVPSRAKRKVKENSIIYSTVRPNQHHYGIIKDPVDNMIVSTGFVVLDSRIDFIKNDILYFWLIQDNHTEVLQAIGETSTSTYPSIKPSDIANMKLVLPPKVVIEGLSDKFDKINLYINQLRNEEKQLIELRDSLLPKLMSGEIRVEDIEGAVKK